MAADPGQMSDATLAFIGRIRTEWTQGDCPKNLREARERGGSFVVEVDAPYRPGLEGLQKDQPVILMYWTGLARRDLIVQTPAHRPEPTGVFALRSPARPNPIALAVTRIIGLDHATGKLTIEAIDAFDGTPLLDIKPWLPSVDIPPDA